MVYLGTIERWPTGFFVPFYRHIAAHFRAYLEFSDSLRSEILRTSPVSGSRKFAKDSTYG
jgi:hypothetical protein